MKYDFYFKKLEAFWQRRKWWIVSVSVAVIACGIASNIYLQNQAPANATPPTYIADSVNFVNARARFNSYSDKFVEINKLSGGMADQMRDSVNYYYRIADSLKTVFEQSKAGR